MYFESEGRPRQAPSDQALRSMMRRNNPENKPTGPYTGRCKHCGSTNLWDDNSAYGCKDCGAVYC